MKKLRPFSCVVLMLLLTGLAKIVSAGAGSDEGPALRGLDPVELVAGREVSGQPDVVATYGKYRYVFSSEANRATFQQDPSRYAVQFGGACMRMGPLSGGGSSDRYHVHDGRIYLFASESCRNTFLSDPARFIDTADAEPVSSRESEQQAAVLLQKAVEGLGGDALLRKLKTLEIRLTVTQKSGAQVIRFSRISATSFPLTFTRVDDYGTSKSGWTLHPDQGYLSWEHGVPVDESVRQYMLREYYRLPIHLLRGWLDKQVRATFVGNEQVGGQEVACVAMSVEGATTRVCIRPDDGMIVRVAWRGRASAGISDIVRDYSDFRQVNGLTVPFGVSTLIDGRPQENAEVIVDTVRVNETLAPELLARPR